MLSRVGETAGLPMAVFTDRATCEQQVALYYKMPLDHEREMQWRCLGVIMPPQ